MKETAASGCPQFTCVFHVDFALAGSEPYGELADTEHAAAMLMGMSTGQSVVSQQVVDTSGL